MSISFKSLLLLITAEILFSHQIIAQEVSIGQLTLALFDSSRNRPVITEIWYPTEDTITAADHNAYIPFVRTATKKDGKLVVRRHSPLFSKR